jgi:chromosome segregation ATPase
LNKLIDISKEKESRMDEEKIALNEHINGLGKNVLESKVTISGLEKNVLVLENNIEGLETDILELNVNISGFEKNILGLEKNVLGLNEHISVLEKNVLGLEKNVFELEDNVRELNDQTNLLEVQLESTQQILIDKEKHGIHIQHEFDMRIQDMMSTMDVTAEESSMKIDELTYHYNFITETLQQDLDRSGNALKETVEKHDENIQKYEKLIVKNNDCLCKIGSLEKELADSMLFSQECTLELKEHSLQAVVSTERMADLTLELLNCKEQLKLEESGTYVHIRVYTYICMYTYIYVYVYIYIQLILYLRIVHDI